MNITGIDINSKAVELANLNAKKILNKSQLECLTFKEASFNLLFDIDNNTYFDTKYDIIVSNPPYISLKEKYKFQKDLMYESNLALYSGEDGLDLIKDIIIKSKRLLNLNGVVILEVGYDQKDLIFDLLLYNRISNFYFEKDLFGIERFVVFYPNK